MVAVRRAMLLVVASSVLVPVVGVVTAPVLAHALGPDGRGISAAAAAPFFVASTVGSLGIPQAITYFVAQDRRMAKATVPSVLGITVLVGVAASILIGLFRRYLSDGAPQVSDLIVLGGLLVTPALLVGILRGLATGLQMWREVAAERVFTTAIKAIGIVGLAISGNLDVLAAVVVLCISPILGGLSYWKVLFSGRDLLAARRQGPSVGTFAVLRYGSSVWLGGVALMLMARVNEMFVLPLSDAYQLGLLVVAVTVSDIPWIVTQALRDVLFGTSSRDMDPQLLGKASRLSTAGAVCLGAGIGGTMPLWLGVVFGTEFRASFWPAIVLLFSAAAAVPGLVAGAGLEAAGRPKVRSMILVGSLVLNLLLLFALTPELGAIGAAGAVLGSTIFATAITVVAAARVLEVPVRLFITPQVSDVSYVNDVLRSAGRFTFSRLNRQKGGNG